MTAKLTAPGLVVVADMYYPGWNLEVDGKPAEIELFEFLQCLPEHAGDSGAS